MGGIQFFPEITGRRFKPYPDYKDSCIDWLSKIPAHWEVKKLAWLTDCLDGRRIPLNAEERGRMQGEFPYWGANSIVDHVDRWLFDEELVLLGEDGAPFFDRLKPVAFRVSGKIWVNNHAHVLRPIRTIDGSFLAFALNCVDYSLFIEGTTRDKLTQGDMMSIPIQCPHIPEQRIISAFLDRETAKIDALIAKKERLIELLQEKRTALITQAVTKGLDPNVPMKDSGIEWLGKIPAHWEVLPLKHLLSRYDYGLSENLADLGDVRVLTMANIQDGEINLTGSGCLEWVPDEFLLDHNDLLFNRTNSRELVGKVGLFRGSRNDNVSFASYLVRMRTRKGVSPQFLDYLLNSAVLLALARSMALLSINQANLNPTKYTKITIPLPTEKEQQSISSLLKGESQKLEVLTAKIRKALDRLKEYRTTLISAAVTGKIDVRGES